MKGVNISSGDGYDRAVIELLKGALESGVAGTIMISLETPGGDSFAYVVVQDPKLLEHARALPPIMSVQGARALSDIAPALGEKILIAVMRPCEVNAVIELAKLKQIDLSRVVLIGMDCPGAVPISKYLDGSVKNPEPSDEESVRPVCKACVVFATTGDVHVATLGLDGKTAFLLPKTEKGEGLLKDLGLEAEADITLWQRGIEPFVAKRGEARSAMHKSLATEVQGLDKMSSFFRKCIGCHNCGSVCPICYCRQCYIEGEEWKAPGFEYLDKARNAGAVRVPPDTILFHVGRMAHMSLSCVSCGVCEDACPADIPIAQLFSMVADETQKLFDYVPGANADLPVPLATYEEDELHEVED